MIKSIVWTYDHRLLQESNLTVLQPCRVPITFCVKFSKHSLANDGPVNLTEDTGIELGSCVPCASVFPTTLRPSHVDWWIECTTVKNGNVRVRTLSLWKIASKLTKLLTTYKCNLAHSVHTKTIMTQYPNHEIGQTKVCSQLNHLFIMHSFNNIRSLNSVKQWSYGWEISDNECERWTNIRSWMRIVEEYQITNAHAWGISDHDCAWWKDIRSWMHQFCTLQYFAYLWFQLPNLVHKQHMTLSP